MADRHTSNGASSGKNLTESQDRHDIYPEALRDKEKPLKNGDNEKSAGEI
jgi:hypothetical protein